MNNIIAIIFGIVQGLTEFIPVSSSGHLLLLHSILPSFHLTDELAFDVALHVGTLAALLAVFWRDCWRYLRAAVASEEKLQANTQLRQEKHIAFMIFIAMLPAGVAGVLFEPIIETVLRSPLIVVVMLILVAILFFVVEARAAKKEQPTQQQTTTEDSLHTLTWKRALFIGCMQVLALIPGTSRSGITMVGGMFANLSRSDAARFSFLVAIPLIAGAGLKKLLDVLIMGVVREEIPLLLLGMLSAAAVGYIAIKILLQYLQTRTLKPFAVYRIALAVAVLLIFYL
jgi:undecaprenyl-diphosphatase